MHTIIVIIICMIIIIIVIYYLLQLLSYILLFACGCFKIKRSVNTSWFILVCSIHIDKRISQICVWYTFRFVHFKKLATHREKQFWKKLEKRNNNSNIIAKIPIEAIKIEIGMPHVKYTNKPTVQPKKVHRPHKSFGSHSLTL